MSNGSSPRTDAIQISRREALGGLALGAALALPANGSGGDGSKPSDRINIGVIGFGPRCTYVMNAMLGLPDVRCVALADVQKSRREAGKALVDKLSGTTDCATYTDLRKLLDRNDVQAVVVATGDRWHTPASLLPAEAGKDVYCEKPCGLSIKNVQDLAAVMKKTGRVFQAGTHRRSVPHFQTAVELARGGKLGKLDTLYASGTSGRPCARMSSPCPFGVVGRVVTPSSRTGRHSSTSYLKAAYPRKSRKLQTCACGRSR